MDARTVCLSLVLAGAGAAHAGSGLTAPSADTLWPQWQARITVQTAGTLPLAASRLIDAGAPDAQRGLQGGAVFGDYTFATRPYGSFRASGGVLTGAWGGAPLASAALAPRVGLGVSSGGAVPWGPGAFNGGDASGNGTVPYFGLGFSGSLRNSALAFSADLGLVAERPSAAGGVGRAIFGNQGFETALRELRLAPVLQLGVRYSF